MVEKNEETRIKVRWSDEKRNKKRKRQENKMGCCPCITQLLHQHTASQLIVLYERSLRRSNTTINVLYKVY